MQSEAVGHLLRSKCPYNLARLRIPEVNLSIKGTGQELSAIPCEDQVSDGLAMPLVGPNAFLVIVDVPNLAGAIVAGGEHQMTILREELHSLNSFGVADESMCALLGYVTVSSLLSFQLYRWLKELKAWDFKVQCGTGLVVFFVLLEVSLLWLSIIKSLFSHLLKSLHDFPLLFVLLGCLLFLVVHAHL